MMSSFFPKAAFAFVLGIVFFTLPRTTALAEPASDNSFTVQVLGINDFHGQVGLLDGKGGMQRLANHLLSAIESTDDHTFVLHGGDHVGASPAESALLQDEPAIAFLNMLQSFCNEYRQQTCHVLGTAGNHEFDEGTAEMLRLLNGGNHPKGPFIQNNWPGANYQTLSANVIDRGSNNTLLPAFAVHEVQGVEIGIIGITLDYTPELVVPGSVDNVLFESQNQAVNHYVSVLQDRGIEAVIVVVHDGNDADYYPGVTQFDQRIAEESHFGSFIHQLPSEVDLVVSGHSHGFTNVYVERQNAKPLLVTQAFSNGLAYADISLTINKVSGDVEASYANIILTRKPESLELSREANSVADKISTLITLATDYANDYTNTQINTYVPQKGEIALGRFLADSHFASLDADVAVMNSGGVRASMSPGKVTWGDLFAIQPFGNLLMVKQYSGAQLRTLLSTGHYWSRELSQNQAGEWLIQGKKIDDNALYRVGGNNYVMNTKGFAEGELIETAGKDIDATVNYMRQLPSPFNLSDVPADH